MGAYAENVRVLNDTADYYRYLDATGHSEFLYAWVEQTIDHDLPQELAYLEDMSDSQRGFKRWSTCRTGR